MSPSLLAAPLLGALTTSPAQASEDVILSGMGSWNGTAVEPEVVMDSYQVVVNQLGLAVANKPMAPGETLGVYGFDLGVGSTVAFIDTKSVGGSASHWARVHEEGDPNSVLWIPWLQARKGLPLSLEIGANMGYLAFSRQTAFGGYGRWGAWEGYNPIPDLTFQLGYSGYVGNDELELGAFDFSATLGWTLPFGTLVGINQAQFSPFLGVGTVIVHAGPRIGDEEQLDLGITTVSGFKSSEHFDENYRHLNLDGGFRIVSGKFQLRMMVAFAPRQLTTLNAGLGWNY